MSVLALSPETLASARHLATVDIRGLRERIDYARGLTAIAAPGPASGEQALECAAALAREIEWFQSHLRSRGLLPWLSAQTRAKPRRRRPAGVRA